LDAELAESFAHAGATDRPEIIKRWLNPTNTIFTTSKGQADRAAGRGAVDAESTANLIEVG
jgi:hypothetical protein